MLLSPSLFALAAVYFASAASSDGSRAALYSCLKEFDLETLFSPNYTNDSAAFNRRLAFKPVALVFPLVFFARRIGTSLTSYTFRQSAQNVSDIVKCASMNHYKVTARSGGHSYAAYGLGGQNGNVIVDLWHLTQVILNSDHTVDSGAGNRLGALATGIYDQGKRGLPHGTCPYIGESFLSINLAKNCSFIEMQGRAVILHLAALDFHLASLACYLILLSLPRSSRMRVLTCSGDFWF